MESNQQCDNVFWVLGCIEQKSVPCKSVYTENTVELDFLESYNTTFENSALAGAGPGRT